LASLDRSAITYEPETVFVPEYAVAYATDFAVRVIRNRGAKTMTDLRVGWKMPAAVGDPSHRVYPGVRRRFISHLEKNGVDPSFADQPVPDTMNYPGFQRVLQELLTHTRG